MWTATATQGSFVNRDLLPDNLPWQEVIAACESANPSDSILPFFHIKTSHISQTITDISQFQSLPPVLAKTTLHNFANSKTSHRWQGILLEKLNELRLTWRRLYLAGESIFHAEYKPWSDTHSEFLDTTLNYTQVRTPLSNDMLLFPSLVISFPPTCVAYLNVFKRLVQHRLPQRQSNHIHPPHTQHMSFEP